jgi:hypothetical protein
MARVSSILRRYGPRRIWEIIAVDRADSAFLGTLFLTIIVLEFGSIGVLAAEARADNASILTASNVLWWSYVTVTAVRYGDRFPVTTFRSGWPATASGRWPSTTRNGRSSSLSKRFWPMTANRWPG